jgi:hypothetical protein
MNYEPRFYRESVRPQGLVSFKVTVEETDLLICAESDLTDAARLAVLDSRRAINEYAGSRPDFLTSYIPVDVPAGAPDIVKDMAAAAASAGVGPMAAVAGAIAEYVGRELLRHSKEVIVENGGDIFIASKQLRRMAVYAGESPLSEKVIIAIRPDGTPSGVCASSGTVGHSRSFGRADAAVAIAANAAVADAWATRLGNEVRSKDDAKRAIGIAEKSGALTGALVIKDDVLAVWGEIEIEPPE